MPTYEWVEENTVCSCYGLQSYAYNFKILKSLKNVSQIMYKFSALTNCEDIYTFNVTILYFGTKNVNVFY